MKRHDHFCCYCGEWVSKEKATWEHLIPKSKGGNSTIANLKTCCMKCNNERGNRSLTSWLTTLKWKEQMYKGVHRYRAEAMVANVEHWLEYVQENKQKMRTVGINKVKKLSNFKDGLKVYPLGHLY